MARFGLSDSESEGSGSDSQTPPPVTHHNSRKRVTRSASTGRSQSAQSAQYSDEDEEDEDAPPRASLLHSDASDEDMDHHNSQHDSPPPSQPQPQRRTLTSTRSPSSSPEPHTNTLQQQRQQRAVAEQPWASKLKLEPKRVAVMQASFFQQQHNTSPAPAPASTLNKVKEASSNTAEAFSRPTSAPTTAVVATPALDPSPFRPYTLYSPTPLASSITKGHEGNLIDLGLSLGRSFRVGHGPRGEVVRLAAPGDSGKGASLRIERVKSGDTFSPSTHLRTLTLQLSHTTIYPPSSSSSSSPHSAPSAAPSPELCFGHFVASSTTSSSTSAAAEAAQVGKEEAHLWQLGQALFDEIPNLALPSSSPSSSPPSAQQTEYIHTLRRRALLSSFLSTIVRPEIETSLRSLPSSSSSAGRIFHLLSGHQISRAVESALSSGDLRLATLVAQAGEGGDDEFREDVYLQLAKWREYKVDEHIKQEYRRVYELLCGNVGVSEGRKGGGGEEEVQGFKVAEGLGWKRALGLHLWYGTFGASVTTAVERYEEALALGEVAAPLPSYLSSSSSSSSSSTTTDATDPLFQLLKLFTSPTHSLEEALMPRNFSASPTEYRLSWHLYMLLSRVLRRRDFEDRLEVEGDREDDEEMDEGQGGEREGNSVRADLLTMGYADQLEKGGMWQWAVFVLLHLELPDGREKAIRDLLTRNAAAIEEETFTFLTETLKVPPTWIYSAQATASTYNSDPFTTYKLLMAAEQWSQAHEIVVHTLAPEAVIRGDIKLLERLLEPIDETKVEGWEEGGQTFLDYFHCLSHQHALHAPVAVTSTSSAELHSRHAHLLSVIDAVQRLAARKDLQRKERIKLKVAVAEMMSRLTVLARGADEYLARIQPSTLQESDRLTWIAGANAGLLKNSLKAACAA